ncbi:MAG: DUF1573 domain-containing protein [Acidobacteriia bacterium]|nr:DUF1573 domain-containing protein [Terriglobia bacterium]
MKKKLFLTVLVSSVFFGFFPTLSVRAGDNPLGTQLRARVTEFWTAWSRGEAEKTNLLVREEDRQAFAKIRRFDVLDFKIDSLLISADSKSAVVRTNIKRTLPMSPAPVDWMVENQWVYEKGDWYLLYSQNKQPAMPAGEVPSLFNAGSTPAQPAPPNDIVFDSTTFDFGTMPASTGLHHVFPFENRGTRALRLVRLGTPCQGLFATPQCKGVIAHSDGSVYGPGKKGKIEAQWQNVLTPQKVDQTIELYFDNGQVFNLRIVGTVTESKVLKP